MRVRWDDDGSEEDVTISGTTTFMSRGGVRHQALVDPDVLIARLKDDPTSVFVQALREYGTPMTATVIKERFRSLGLDREIVDRAWKRAQTKLGEQENVTVSGKKYKWRDVKSNAALSEPEASAGDGSASGEKPETEELPVEVSQEEPSELIETPALPAQEPAPGQSSVEKHGEPLAEGNAAARSTEGRLPLAQAIAVMLGDEPTPDVVTYASRPLATGVRLGELGDAQIDSLLTSVHEEERLNAISLLAALPRSSKVIDSHLLVEVPTETVRIVLAASTAELRDVAHGKQSTAAAGWLLQRIGDLPPTPELLPAFIGLAVTIARDPSKNDLVVLDRAAHVLHGWLTQMAKEECEDIAPETLAHIAIKLPLTLKGGRAALLAAVGQLWPEKIADEIWWRDVTLKALSDSAPGVLGRVTSQPEVAERVVAPLMARELTKTTSRVRLASLLALPHEFVAHLPAAGVASVFRRVAVDDPLVDSWVGSLTGTSRVAQLKGEVELAQAESQRASGRAEQAEKRAHDLAARCEQLEKLLRQQHEHSVGMRAAQERQLQIDAIRALADLAADVEELAVSGATPEVLVERVRALVSDQDLEGIGQAGTELAFDPELHEPLVGAPQVGDAVTVLRPGYRWRSQEEALLARALVSVAQT